jgi:hypothetical protein
VMRRKEHLKVLREKVSHKKCQGSIGLATSLDISTGNVLK